MMSEQQLKQRYDDLEASRVAGKEEVDAGVDQDVARLFLLAEKEGWTQENIGKVVGKGQQWVSRQLIFGRFLNYAGRRNSFSPPKPLTEWRFRKNWKASGKQPKETEDERFARVLEMVKKDDSERHSPDATIPKQGIRKAILKSLDDGRQHTTAEILEAVKTGFPDTSEKQVQDNIQDMKKRFCKKGYTIQSKRGPRHTRYKLVKRAVGDPVDPEEAGGIIAEVIPLLEETVTILKGPEVNRANSHALENVWKSLQALKRLQ